MLSASLRLAPTGASVPAARRFVLGLLHEWSLTDLADTVALLTSEVVTNAVLHARTELVVTATHMGRAVQVQVHDGSPIAPVQRRHTAEATTGRGVRLLDQLATGWEVVSDGRGKTVCFTVDAGIDPWAAFGPGSWQDAEL